MHRLMKISVMAVAIAISNQSAYAESALPLCETSTGVSGQLFEGFVATVVGPEGAKWAYEASSFSIEDGSLPLADQTRPFFGTGVVTSFGIFVRPSLIGEVEIEFYDPDKTELMGTCRAQIVQFNPEIHSLDALRGGTCPLSGDFETPILVGETRIFRTPPGLLAGSSRLDRGQAEIDRRDGAYAITGMEEGIVNFMASTRTREPFADRKYGLCAVEVTDMGVLPNL